jgi:hypothetical protein
MKRGTLVVLVGFVLLALATGTNAQALIFLTNKEPLTCHL